MWPFKRTPTVTVQEEVAPSLAYLFITETKESRIVKVKKYPTGEVIASYRIWDEDSEAHEDVHHRFLVNGKTDKNNAYIWLKNPLEVTANV